MYEVDYAPLAETCRSLLAALRGRVTAGRVKFIGWLLWHIWGETYARATVDDLIEICTIGDTNGTEC